MELDQGGAGLADLAIVAGQAAAAVEVFVGERAQLGLAVVAPREHGGRVAGGIRSSAMTGWLAAAGLQIVDGAFEEFAHWQELLD